MLESIKNISDLKQLPEDKLPALCDEIRQKLIVDVLTSGGHLASNLGVVELTVALHYVFSEDDKIVWDVGHQSYVHKILTSRGENFCDLRTMNGISGFPDCSESETDSFNTGHAGTSISAALGLAKARDNLRQNHNVVAVVGDGALTCGMTYEALNNVKGTKMLIVLNDNNMSIGDNVGVAMRNLSKLRVGKYDTRKESLKHFLQKIPLIGKPTYRFLRWCKRKVKAKYVRNSYFDNFDIKYVGIVDGNEVKDLVYYFTKIRDNVNKPTVLHVITKKGKGYAPAENDPVSYHSVPCASNDMQSSVTVGDTLVSIAQMDNTVCAISAAMTNAVGLKEFSALYPDRFWDVGIAEEHAVTFAAGLAKGGMKPFVAIYSSFLQRSYDQILHDVALQNLPVTMLIDRAGFVGADGQTHQGLFDLAFLSVIPNLTVLTPATYRQLHEMILFAAKKNAPIAIRYPRSLNADDVGFDGCWVYLKKVEQPKITIFAVGPGMCGLALSAELPFADVVCVTSVKPLDEVLLKSLVAPCVLTLEEGVLIGGFGERLSAYFSDTQKVVRSLGVDDKFVKHATISQQREMCGLNLDNLLSVVQEMLQNDCK